MCSRDKNKITHHEAHYHYTTCTWYTNTNVGLSCDHEFLNWNTRDLTLIYLHSEPTTASRRRPHSVWCFWYSCHPCGADKQLWDYVSAALAILQLSNTAVDVYCPRTPFDMIPVLVSHFEPLAGVYLSFPHHNEMLCRVSYRSGLRRTVIEAQCVFTTRLRPDCPLPQRTEQPTAGICLT